MASWFQGLNPVYQALLAGLFTWAITALGAATVFLFQHVNRKLLDGMLGFAAGVMIAASYWSLLAPAIDIAEAQDSFAAWIPAAVGFMSGMLCLWSLDKILPHLHLDLATEQAEGLRSRWQRSILLVSAITLHNIPEGLAVGVAFGGVLSGLPSTSMGAAVALAVGIGIQNFPEGLAVAVPLRGEGVSRGKAFWFGQLSAAVEPVAAALGAAAVIYMSPILPYALAFAAGAMIFVVVEELIPESQRAGNVDLSTAWLAVGFTIMMILDVAMG